MRDCLHDTVWLGRREYPLQNRPRGIDKGVSNLRPRRKSFKASVVFFLGKKKIKIKTKSRA